MQSFNQGLILSERTQEVRRIAALIAARRLAVAASELADPTIALADHERKLGVALIRLMQRAPEPAASELAQIAIPDGDLGAHLLTARCLVMARRPRLALRHFAAVRAAVRNSDLSYRAGAAALAANEPEEAVTAFTEALESRPHSKTVLLGKGKAEFRADRRGDAIATLESVLRADPDCIEAIGYLAFTRAFYYQWAEAEPLLLRVIKVRPDWTEAVIHYGHLLLNTDRVADARAYFAELQARYPGDQWVRYFYDLSDWSLSKDEARLMDARLALVNISKTMSRRASCFGGSGHFSGGLAEAWYALGLAHARSNQSRSAIVPLKHAFMLAPSCGIYCFHLANQFFKLSKFRAALFVISMYRPAPDPWLDRELRLLRALSYSALGATREALIEFNSLIVADPQNCNIYLALAKLHMNSGDLEAAERALATVVRINPHFYGLSGAIHDIESLLKRSINPDAGLAPLGNYRIPPEFQLQLSDPGLNRKNALLGGMASHMRAIRAMIRRELLGRYGRNQAGYLWAVLQPLLYVATFEVIFIFAQRHPPLGVTLEQFLVTGIVPVICFFTNVEQKVMSAINGSKGLLYFREVTTLNIMLAAWILEFMTAIVAMLAILCVLFLIGQHFAIRDVLSILSALAGLSLIGAVTGGLFGVLSLRFPSAIFIGRALSRFLFFLSGAFFYANELPPSYREYILLNPVFHYVELLREGFFTSYQATYASWAYPLQFSIPGLALLLLADRVFRRHVFET